MKKKKSKVKSPRPRPAAIQAPSNPLDSENWASESSLRSFGDPPVDSGNGGDTTLSIEFTAPASGESIACGETITGKATASGPGGTSAFITVIGPDGIPCGQGMGHCDFEYTPRGSDCGKTVTFTASATECADGTGTALVTCDGTSAPPQSVEITEDDLEEAADDPPGGVLGLTDYNPEPTFESDVFCDGSDQTWTRRITSATFRQRQRIIHSSSEITEASIAEAKCHKLGRMAGRLVYAMEHAEAVHNSTPRSVIEAHEDVHVTNTSAYMRQLYATLVSDVEAIKVPSGGVDHDQAMSDTEAAYVDAVLTFRDALKDADANDGNHQPPEPFIAAQRAAAEIWYDRVSARYRTLACEEDLPVPSGS